MSRRPSQKTFAVILLLLVSSFSVNAQNNSLPEVSEEALLKLTRAITEIQAEIGRRNSDRSSVYQKLQETEQSLAAVTKDINRIDSEIRENQSSLTQLTTERRQLQSQKESQQKLITQYLRSAYQTGQQEYFKLLLNQKDPVLASRTLRYYRYFSEARSNKIREYNLTLQELQVVSERISQTTSILDEQQHTLAEKENALQSSAKERKNLLDELDAQLSSSNTKLQALEAERAEMELLIEELRRSIADLSLEDQQQPFASRKGQLPWPVSGSLSNRWGSSYGNGDLTWQGVTITAREGEDIRAIHHGRVVFSDWFSSSGLLLIIDHGDGYMSLYAHNQALYKDVGEWVNSGEIIAATGNTGGQDDFGLYFEIRHNGESENPSTWCQARN